MSIEVTEAGIIEKLGRNVNLPIDQARFIVTQMIALLFAFAYPKIFDYSKVSTSTRHYASLLSGIILLYFCFGNQIVHMLALGTLCYIAIITCKPHTVHLVVLFVAMLYLSSLHLNRQLRDYGGYTLDITGPLMIAVQKLTSLAFCVHDGKSKSSEKQTDEQRQYAISISPSLLEYSSYLFHFQNLMSGPLIYYTDYIEFIEGTNFSKHSQTIKHSGQPSPFPAVIWRLWTSIPFTFLFVVIGRIFPSEQVKNEQFLNDSSFITILVYLFLITTIARFKYYFAWNLGEAICNASGLGFNGFTPNGVPRWDLASSVDIFRHETSLNLRDATAAWNKMTQTWLRRTGYERTKMFPTLATFILSALWHGFYPGYYLTFLSAALFIHAARTARRYIRPLFQANIAKRITYDTLTFITTRIFLAYLMFPFILLEFDACLQIFVRLYFFGHICALFAIFVLPRLFSAPKAANVTNKN